MTMRISASPRDIEWTMRELESGLAAGESAAECVTAMLLRAPYPKLRRRLRHLHMQLEAGSALPAALSAANLADAFTQRMLEEADPQGQAAQLRLLAADARTAELFRQTIGDYLRMPVLTASLVLLMIGFLLGWVVPSFVSIYESFGAVEALPLATRALALLSSQALAVGAALAIVILITVGLLWKQQPAGLYMPLRTWIDRWTPLAKAHRLRSVALLLSGAAQALRNGLALPTALQIASSRAQLQSLRWHWGALFGDAAGEQKAVDALSSLPEVPPSALRALRNNATDGEHCADVLLRVASQIDDDALATGMRGGELLSISARIVLGLLVLFVFIAIYAPIFRLGALT